MLCMLHHVYFLKNTKMLLSKLLNSFILSSNGMEWRKKKREGEGALGKEKGKGDRKRKGLGKGRAVSCAICTLHPNSRGDK